MKFKVLFFTNIMSPYRNDFFNLLAEHVDLTVVYQSEFYGGVPEGWHPEKSFKYEAVFLTKGSIDEKEIKFKGLIYLFKEWDYIFFTNYGYISELLYIMTAIVFKKVYILEVDGLISKKDSFIKKLIKRAVFKRARFILTPGKSMNKVVHEYAQKAQVLNYPFSSIKSNEVLNVVDAEKNKRNLRSMLDLNSTDFILLSVGQFIDRKGFDILLRAASEIEFKADMHLILVGGKPPLKYKRLAGQVKIKVTFLPFLDKNSVYELMKASDLFVLATREDVWGLVVNEAMAMGLPVITTNRCNSGLELIENGFNGFIVQVEDYFKIAEHISYLYSNRKLLRSMSKNAVKTSRNYTIEGMVERHVQIFKQFID